MDYSKIAVFRWLKKQYHKSIPDQHIKKAPGGNYIFVHVNKTGGTSILKALKHPKKLHYTAREIQEKIGQENWRKSLSFAFVRNPYDRVVSQYKYRIKTNQNALSERTIDFNQWVKKVYGPHPDPFYRDTERMFITQKQWLTNAKGQICVDYIGRFENLVEDFTVIANKIKPGAKLEHRNQTSRKKPYQDYYDLETQEIITNYFSEDFEAFDYNIEKI